MGKFSDKNQSAIMNQRVLTVTGDLEAVNSACLDVVNRIQSNSHLEGIMVHDVGAGTHGSGYAQDSPRPRQDSSRGHYVQDPILGENVEIAFDVPDMRRVVISGAMGAVHAAHHM